MKFIRIKNAGIIEPQALHLLGASTKRNDNTKIGQFGSGNKYAIAYLLRNGYSLNVFAGKQEVSIETKPEKFRDQEFNLVYINGEKTSITTEMGKDWQFWQAIREIYCNAIDEGGCTMDFVQEFSPVENETHFYIDTKKDVLEFVSNFDNYFATNKKVIFECEFGRILEKSGTSANIYRKGIRCHNTKKTSMYDYDFSEMEIDENRLVRYYWQIEEKIWKLLFMCDNEEVIMNVLHNSSNHEFIEANIGDISSINSNNISDVFKNCIKKSRLCPHGYAGMLNPDEQQNHIIVPTKIFASVRGYIGDENVGDKFKVSRNGVFYRETEMNPLQRATLDKVLYFFKEVNFEVNYDICAAIFEDKSVLGFADLQSDKIVISDICFEKGANELVNTIIEEYIHLKYKAMDETRAFQTAIITEMVSYMKKNNSFVL